MRKQRIVSAEYEEGFSSEQAKKLIDELRWRVEKLEEEVFYGVGIASPKPPEKPRLGRKPLLEESEVLQRCRSLTTWLGHT